MKIQLFEYLIPETNMFTIRKGSKIPPQSISGIIHKVGGGGTTGPLRKSVKKKDM